MPPQHWRTESKVRSRRSNHFPSSTQYLTKYCPRRCPDEKHQFEEIYLSADLELAFQIPLRPNKQIYNLDKSGILHSSACGEGISFTTTNKLGCLCESHSAAPHWETCRRREHRDFPACCQPRGARLTLWVLCHPQERALF